MVLMRGTFTIALLTVLVLSSLPVDAAVGLTMTSDQSCAVTPGEYSIGVTNEEGFADTFRITSLGTHRSWVVFENTKLELSDGESGSFELSASAPDAAPAGFYDIPIVIYSENDESLREETSICLVVKRVDKLEVTGIAFEDASLGPGDTVKISVVVENSGTEPFRNVDLKLEVTGPEHIDLDDVLLALMDRREIEVVKREIPVTNTLKAGDYSVRATLVKDDVVLDVNAQTFTVEAVRQVDRDVVADSGIFTRYSIVTLTNTGNVDTVETVNAEVRKPFNVFSSAPGATVTTEGGKAIYTWAVSLEPGQSSTVTFRVRYWPFLILFAVILYAAYQYYVVSKRPSIHKHMLSKRNLKDDINEYAISLQVKNTTPFMLKNVVVRDFVPALARVIKDFKVKPDRAKFVEAGTELVWKFDMMKPGETRIVHYRIANTVGTVDLFHLPPAVIEGSRGTYIYRVHSNVLSIGSRKNIQ